MANKKSEGLGAVLASATDASEPAHTDTPVTALPADYAPPGVLSDASRNGIAIPSGDEQFVIV